MKTENKQVGKKAREMFAEVRSIGKKVLEKFLEGFSLALKDVHSDWKNLEPRMRKNVFDEVQLVAKEMIVDKSDGGNAEDGLSLGTFYGYVCKVKKALLYNVPLHVADKATQQELQRARDKVRVEFNAASSPKEREEIMVSAYDAVKADQLKAKEELRETLKTRKRAATATTLNTAFALPNPIGCDDSEALLQNGIRGILVWLRSPHLKQHLQKDLPIAKALRNVMGDLVVHEVEPDASSFVAAGVA